MISRLLTTWRKFVQRLAVGIRETDTGCSGIPSGCWKCNRSKNWHPDPQGRRVYTQVVTGVVKWRNEDNFRNVSPKVWQKRFPSRHRRRCKHEVWWYRHKYVQQNTRISLEHKFSHVRKQLLRKNLKEKDFHRVTVSLATSETRHQRHVISSCVSVISIDDMTITWRGLRPDTITLIPRKHDWRSAINYSLNRNDYIQCETITRNPSLHFFSALLNHSCIQFIIVALCVFKKHTLDVFFDDDDTRLQTGSVASLQIPQFNLTTRSYCLLSLHLHNRNATQFTSFKHPHFHHKGTRYLPTQEIHAKFDAFDK